MIKKLVPAAIVLLDLIILTVLGYDYLKVRDEYKAEAGESVTADSFLSGKGHCTFPDGSTSFIADSPGVYQVTVKAGLFLHTVNVMVEDTLAPTADSVPVRISHGKKVNPEAFVHNIQDATGIRVSYETEPDWNESGTREVTVILEDETGNKNLISSTLTIQKVNTDEVYTMEAGSSLPDVKQFLYGTVNHAEYLTDRIQLKETGIHDIPIIADGDIYIKKVEVCDTTAPVFTTKNLDCYVKKLPEAWKFAENCTDATEVTFHYEKEPVITDPGEYVVLICATDAFGNRAVQEAEVSCKEDKEKPVLKGIHNITVEIGENIAYRKGVTAFDNCDGEIDFTVDSGNVDTAKKGRYTVIYTATDSSGNTRVKKIKVSVVAKKQEPVDEDLLNEYVDEILEQMISEDMTQRQICEAIYTYIKSNMHYVSTSDKSNYVIAAMNALNNGKGDCYSFASVSKVMLTRAGITNMDISKIPAETNHYWNLVDLGEGWLHFDATPRADKKVVFLMTEKELLADDVIAKSHNYDREQYPVVKQY